MCQQTLPDRKAAAARLLLECPQWSDRRIGSATGLAAKTVGRERNRLGRHTGARVGQDGRVRPTNSAERRLLARELMADQPHLSLRQIAAAVGISPETARAVRRELRGGPRPSARRVSPATPRPVDDSPRPDLPALLHWLRRDPSVRSSHNGRVLLRLLHLQQHARASWIDMADHIPVHCRRLLAEFARQNAAVWRVFADRLELDTEGAAECPVSRPSPTTGCRPSVTFPPRSPRGRLTPPARCS
ncbi:streptomycin biosynthesis protein [Crossiella sp. SN42]|uniref:streptomycin biosynthesis protein n=1 Tax=Crossiella sp. SN42 TaxID=2944808 RepID=UPI00207CA1CC|nr:streptomycin biosynthesis protein [Crossiella sp. SN42]MCO1574554.1 streptomycin biosynthesis protein [Crossiella sp. SN42]